MKFSEIATATAVMWSQNSGMSTESRSRPRPCKSGRGTRIFIHRSHSPAILISTFIVLSVCIYSVVSETQWVWSQNRQPHSGLGLGGSGSGNGGNTIFPESPQRPSSSSSNNDALPPGTIRIVNTMGEARLIPGAGKFVSDAINNILDRQPGGGSAGGTGGGSGGGGLLSIGSGFIGSLGSVLGALFNRNPSSSQNSNNNNGGSSITNTGNGGTETIPPFPVIGSGGGSTTFPANPIGGGGGSTGGGGGGGANCRCIPLNQCFLPSRPNGDCAGGNTNCCATSQSTRAISADDLLINGVRLGGGGTRTLTPTDVRVGLLENIVRGSSTVLDDALDLVLHPWLTQEDQQKIASRIGNNGRKR